MDESFKPRFVRHYATLGATIKEAIGHYVTDVRAGSFPSDAESFTVAESKAAPGVVAPALYSTAGHKG
jgi:ketopantoate hydroxymethyltransferase